MVNPINSVLSINDARTYMEDVQSDIIKTSGVRAPFLMKHMATVSKMGSKVQWFQQAISRGVLTLTGSYSAGGTTFTVAAPTRANPFDVEIKPGITRLVNQSGSAKWLVTGANGAFTSLTVQLLSGYSDPTTLAVGTQLFTDRAGEIGDGFGSNNDISLAGSDYNFYSNFFHDIQIAGPVANGKFNYAGINELDFSNQEENLLPTIIRMMERKALKDIRLEGSNPLTADGFTRTSGTGAQAGGLKFYIENSGGYTVTGGSASLTEATVEADVISLRDRGALQGPKVFTRPTDLSNIDMYVSENGLSALQSQVRFQRENAQNSDGGLGSSQAYHMLVNGCKLNAIVSDGVGDNEVFYVPVVNDVIQINVMRMFEKVGNPVEDGDGIKQKYGTTFTECVKAPWTLGYRNNLVVI